MSGADIQIGHVAVDDLTIQYRELGEGPPVLLVHGWPTSSFLWRNIMPIMAGGCRVLAIDMPGFGGSDKPVDRDYDESLFNAAFDGFLDGLGIDEPIGLAVHDAGGPFALYWASQRPELLSKLAVLNTIVYPEMSLPERAFMAACRTPGIGAIISSQWALRQTMRYGVKDAKRLGPEVYEGVTSPFRDRSSRKVLIKKLADFNASTLETIGDWIPTLDIPVTVIRGAADRILPRMDRTAARLQADLPHATAHVLEDCGHFLQEERPEEVGRLLADFFAP